MKKVLLSVGEGSGDVQAELVMRAFLVLRNSTSENKDPIHFFAICGNRLKQLAQEIADGKFPNSYVHIEEIFSLEELSVMGFSDVAKNYGKIRSAFQHLLNLTRKENITFAFLVDYPGFNLRLAEQLFYQKVKVCYHVVPKFWAHGAARAEKLAKYCELIVSILPFEKTLIEKELSKLQKPLENSFFTGNPLKDGVTQHKIMPLPRINADQNHLQNPKDEVRIALIPGSRASEVRYGIPLLFKSLLSLKGKFELANRHSQITAYLPIAPSFEGTKKKWFEKIVEQTFSLLEKEDAKWLKNHVLFLTNGNSHRTYDVFAQCHYGWVCSGTASLEASFFKMPLSVFFVTSAFNMQIAKRLVKCKYISLTNLCANAEIFPEFVQENATEFNLSQHAFDLLSNAEKLNSMRHELERVSEMFPEKSHMRAAHSWIRFLNSEA